MVSEYMNMDEVVAILSRGVRSKLQQLHRWCFHSPENTRDNEGGELRIKLYHL